MTGPLVRSNQCRIKFDPINPAPPVTRIGLCIRPKLSHAELCGHSSPVRVGICERSIVIERAGCLIPPEYGRTPATTRFFVESRTRRSRTRPVFEGSKTFIQ